MWCGIEPSCHRVSLRIRPRSRTSSPDFITAKKSSASRPCPLQNIDMDPPLGTIVLERVVQHSARQQPASSHTHPRFNGMERADCQRVSDVAFRPKPTFVSDLQINRSIEHRFLAASLTCEGAN